MDKVSTYRIPAAPGVVRAAAREEALPAVLAGPLQTLVTGVTRRGADGPLSIYVCSADDAAELRDDFAYLLARALKAHVPSALVVDCDFLNAGLHGLVPQKDALGFLDFLLYGSSIGVITQEARSVRVVGAGSFPVTRRMPFVETAFAESARRLAAHARCAIFVGPMNDELGDPHPLAGEVDVVVVVASGERGASLREGERMSARAADVWTIMLGAAPQEARTAEKTAAPAGPRPAAVSPPPRVLPTGVPPSAKDRAAEPRYTSLAPRIAIVGFGVIVLAFAGWWFTQGRDAAREPGEETATTSGGPSATAGETAAADSIAPAGGPGVDTTVAETAVAPQESTGVTPPLVNPADTGGRTGGTQLLNPTDIHVMADLDARWRDWYVIHISSFQESIRAREEVDFLQSREFPVFIVFLDLGPKGRWYRVYCGPFRTREEARDVKKNLDAVPQVRFTRIARIPE